MRRPFETGTCTFGQQFQYYQTTHFSDEINVGKTAKVHQATKLKYLLYRESGWYVQPTNTTSKYYTDFA